MGTENAPERAAENYCTMHGSRPKTRDVAFLAPDRAGKVQVAVTPLQHRLVRVARMLAIPPTARELAQAADVDFPTTCAELKVLARLGVIEWGRAVRVLREPDGLFFAPRCGASLRDGGPEAVAFCAGEQAVAT